MSQVMTIEEINSQFESEWVLVSEPEVEDNLLVKRGEVVWHGKDRSELDRKVQELPEPFNIAILYTGTTQDRVFIL
jgi:hypothetical protein